ncbi:hypothetical protein ACFLXG_03075 [Chloroflexota bacterium]
MGKLSGYKTRGVTNCLENKLGIDFGSGSERTGWYWFSDRKILRVTIPKEHGGSSISPGVAKRIISSLRLTNNEFYDLYQCPMSGKEYQNKIKNMIKSGIL